MTRAKALQRISSAIVNQSVALALMNRHEEAVHACDSTIARFGNCDEIGLQEDVGIALIHKAILRSQQDRDEEALSICNQVIERFSGSPSSELYHCAARAHYNKGIILADKLQDFEAATSHFHKSAQMLESAVDYDSIERRGNSLIRQAYTLNLTGNAKAANELYETTYKEFEPRMAQYPKQVANILLNHGILLSDGGYYEESIKTLSKIIEHFHNQPPTLTSKDSEDIRRMVANAWLNLTADLGSLGREKEKIAICQDLINTFHADQNLEIKAAVASAYFNLARGYDEELKREDAIATYRKILDEFQGVQYPKIQEAVAQASVNLALRLYRAAEFEESREIGMTAWNTFKDSDTLEVRRQALMALANVAHQLYEQCNDNTAFDVYTVILKNSENFLSFSMGKTVAFALLNRARLNWNKNEWEASHQDLDQLLELFIKSQDEEVEASVAEAFEMKSMILKVSNDLSALKTCYESALEKFSCRDTHDGHKITLWALYSLGKYALQVEKDVKKAQHYWTIGLQHPQINFCQCCSGLALDMQTGLKGILPI